MRARKVVAVVDGDELRRGCLALMLETAGYRVREVDAQWAMEGPAEAVAQELSGASVVVVRNEGCAAELCSRLARVAGDARLLAVVTGKRKLAAHVVLEPRAASPAVLREYVRMLAAHKPGPKPAAAPEAAGCEPGEASSRIERVMALAAAPEIARLA